VSGPQNPGRRSKDFSDMQSDTVRQSGTVKWFNDAKGFGFITPEDGSEDVFVHFSAVIADGFKSLAEGQRVEYEVFQSEKGLQARSVRMLSSI
jgi:CspA family cold shock protein